MRLITAGMILGWLFLGTDGKSASADGGLLRFAGTKGGYQITVFTAPSPFRAGPVDISALVQDASTGDLVTQARVIVRMTKSGRPALECPATFEAATNKLFRAAQFELPEPGRWAVSVEVEGMNGQAVLGGEVEAAERVPRWREMWPWFVWPVLVIVLFGIHQMLARHPRHSVHACISTAVRSDSQ